MYHFIGIKGSGMSSLAVLFKKLGYEVEGSDIDKHFFTETELIKNNIKILPFKKENIKKGMIIVKGNSFNDENIEVIEAKEKNNIIYTYQEAVDLITKKYNLIAVSGCHGKTTTSSMLAHVMESNYLIGDGSGGITNSNYFVLEACEYKKHFLDYNPQDIIITNIDLDHVDYFKDINEVINAYNEFTKKAELVVAYGDDINIKKLTCKKIYTYGIEKENYFQAKKIEYKTDGIKFDFYVNNEYNYSFILPFYGKHMLLNSLAVIAMSYLKGINYNIINKRLQTFKGAKRRFQETQAGTNIIIDDYAHHPNEIKAIINSVKQKYPQKKIVGIFEPHTYSRVEKFYYQISEALKECDYVYIMEIYKSRENQKNYPKITSKLILDNIEKSESIKEDEIYKLKKYNNCIILFMSPNDLSEMQKSYIKIIKQG